MYCSLSWLCAHTLVNLHCIRSYLVWSKSHIHPPCMLGIKCKSSVMPYGSTYACLAYGTFSLIGVWPDVQPRAGGGIIVSIVKFRCWVCIYSSTRTSSSSYTSTRDCAHKAAHIFEKCSLPNIKPHCPPPVRAKLWPRNCCCFPACLPHSTQEPIF